MNFPPGPVPPAFASLMNLPLFHFAQISLKFCHSVETWAGGTAGRLL